MEPVRVLHIVGRMNRGGQESFIMNLYRNINRKLVQFDFIVHTEEKCDFEDEIISLGGRLHRVKPKKVSLKSNLHSIYRIIKDGKYEIVHRHSNYSLLALDLLTAHLAGARVRISHSHNSVPESALLNYLFRPVLSSAANYKLACSEGSGLQLYGKGRMKEKVKVINNAIDTSLYSYSTRRRNRVREKLGLEDQIVFGHVGRFDPVKNHKFLLDIFYEFRRLNSNSKMILVGDGNQKEEMQEKAIKLGIHDDVMFLGKRSDVNDILMAMDVFVFPSLFEGIPLSLIEAQVSGLPLFISDNITRDLSVTNLVHFLSLEKDAKFWADFINNNIDLENRYSRISEVNDSGYDITNLTNYFENLYMSNMGEILT